MDKIALLLKPGDIPVYPTEDDLSTPDESSSISDQVRKLDLPSEVKWLKPADLIEAGQALIKKVQEGNFVYDNDTTISPSDITEHRAVQRNMAHRPVTEQDDVIISHRHDHNAQDEFFYLTEKLLPDVETVFTAEFTMEAPGV
ncbi:hypothetical protein CMUS01_14227 [Colletotrichum musicola]|uniref:Uncharacterized protein n=1 Tax=Colletotrichum musicola TaxID=2175873 RepID=A0A8H6MS51_9PEZI|nr:hypothetical protein CMUS01_14227 [Colletotrichum musicola]